MTRGNDPIPVVVMALAIVGAFVILVFGIYEAIIHYDSWWTWLALVWLVVFCAGVWSRMRPGAGEGG